MARLGDYISLKTGKLDVNASSESGQYPFFTCAKKIYRIDDWAYDCECVLIAGNGDLNVKYYEGKFNAYQRTYILESKDREKLDVRYLFHFMNKYIETLREGSIGGVIKYIKKGDIEEADIPLVSIDEQRRIAAILDKADEIKQASDKTEDIRRQFGNAIFLDIFGDPVLNTKNWDTLPMTEIFEIITGKLDSNAAVEGGEYPFFTCAKEASQIDHFAFDCECLLLAGNNASGDFDVKYYNGKFNAYQRTYILTTDKINYDYAKFALDYQLKKLKQSSLGTNTRYLTMEIFKRMHIQIPSRDLQQQFPLYYNALKNSAGRDGFKVDELLKSTESLILMNH